MTRIFYRGAHCVFLTYDITRDETFANLVEWLKEIQQHAAEDVKIYLIGNKCEMEDQREVQFARAIEFAKTHGIHKVFETSAKTGQNVEDVFSNAGKELFQQTERENEMDKKNEIRDSGDTKTGGANARTKLGKPKQGGQKQKSGGCC